METIRVLIVDDHRIMREGLQSLLSTENDIEVVGGAETGREAVKLARELRPDVVIMDVAMPELNGVEATRQILSMTEETRVIALSMHGDRQFVSSMMDAGASGFLLKDCAAEELIEAIETVSAGGTFIGRKVGSVLVSDYRARIRDGHSGVETPITPREREVIQLIAEGNSTRKIADALCVSVKTIETHRRNILEKLDLHSVAELTKYAIRTGITSVES